MERTAKVEQQDNNTPRRTSVFKEIGLEETDRVIGSEKVSQQKPSRILRFRSKPDVFEYSTSEENRSDSTTKATKVAKDSNKPRSVLVKSPPPNIVPRGHSMMYRFGAAAFLIAIIIPLLQGIPWLSHGSTPAVGVEGGVIRREPELVVEDARDVKVRRDNSPTDVCVRWAQQSALVNGTLYLYGGEASTEVGQTDNTWNNNFLSLDLTKTWQISTPSLTGLPQPSGPPAVALGTLWNSHDSLFLYGGEVSWKPIVTPPAFSLWEYDIASSTWIEHSSPTTSSGNNSAADDQPVQNAAEGAGLSVPSLGRGFYFGGHQDAYTTPGWVSWIWRIYLTSLLEFTFPGYTNDQVYTLEGGKTAGTDGNWRNITQGGTQSEAGFPERADGLLAYVPGFGADGILIGLAGGTNTTYQQMNIIDVYDIATSTWYKQATSGPTPGIRVNPCAVVAAAPDGSSYNLYMFGGQTLQPAGNQTEYSDMWILTMPSFTWIEVDTSTSSTPYGRSGHTCNIWDGQMIVVGGYVGADLSCDSPGVYVFDLSNLQWVEQFTALSAISSSDSSSSASASASAASASSSSSGGDFVSTSKDNPFNQQPAQLANESYPGGLEGSYGYTVPKAVVSVVGGGTTGGATVTAPAQTATGGPLATGKAITYTVTQSNGATVTETGTAGSGGGTSSTGGSSNSGSGGPNIAAIVAGVIAGLLFILVCYLVFCLWLYRKQLQLYKRHVEMSQAAARGEKRPAIPGLLDGSSAKSSSDRRREGIKTSSDNSATRSGWSGGASGGGSGGQGQNGSGGGSGGYASLRRSSSDTSGEDLLGGNTPTFWGTMLAPRRSLRVINRD